LCSVRSCFISPYHVLLQGVTQSLLMSRVGHVVTSDVSTSHDVITSFQQQCRTVDTPKCVCEPLCRQAQVCRRFGTSCCPQQRDRWLELCFVHPDCRLPGFRIPDTCLRIAKTKRAANSAVTSLPCGRTPYCSRVHIPLCSPFGLLFQLRLPPFSLPIRYMILPSALLTIYSNKSSNSRPSRLKFPISPALPNKLTPDQ